MLKSKKTFSEEHLQRPEFYFVNLAQILIEKCINFNVRTEVKFSYFENSKIVQNKASRRSVNRNCLDNLLRKIYGGEIK